MRKHVFLLVIFTLYFFYGYTQEVDNCSVYFPLPDSLGGWRTLADIEDARQIAKVDLKKLDEAYDFVRGTTKNGGLLVVRNGYLIYERYFGKGQRNAAPNLASCGKSFTSIAIGMLIEEYPEFFPNKLEQKIFTPCYLPIDAFPLSDPRMKEIKLGHLLSFTAGIRGNNPVYINGETSEINPVGPDGWAALVDEYALGIKQGDKFSVKTLWCNPGEGYSYATASIHIASIILRNITGEELEEYIKIHLAQNLGWGDWSYGYKNATQVNHTPGGGGICLRSTDMLRFGYLLLHNGKWREHQIVSEEYIRKATNESQYNPHYPYSLQFNVNSRGEITEIPKDSYWKDGSGGHCLYVVPSLDLVVWKLGGRDDQYSSKNTGLPELSPLVNAEQHLANTQKFSGNSNLKTLELVIQSLIK